MLRRGAIEDCDKDCQMTATTLCKVEHGSMAGGKPSDVLRERRGKTGYAQANVLRRVSYSYVNTFHVYHTVGYSISTALCRQS